MEAREVRYIAIEDKQGTNGEFLFTMNIPIIATWEMAHAAAANFVLAVQELEEKSKKAEQAKQEPTPEIVPEIV